MSLVKEPIKVRQVTTIKGWVYRVLEGTFRQEFIAESADGEQGAWWFTFNAHGKDFGTVERIAIRQSDVKQIMESEVSR